MRSHRLSRGPASELDPVARVVLDFEEAWRSGPPSLDRFRSRFAADSADYGLAELVKADIQCRFQRGGRPTAREYLERYPELAGKDGRAISLIYEEYCLRLEAEEMVDASEFCRAYPSWRDSLASQLKYHRELSRAVEPPPSQRPFPEPGDRFGDYELFEVLGEGSAARVFRGCLTTLGNKEFAIKVSPDRGGEPAILGRLDHPNIIPVTSTVVDPATGFRGLCMPFRRGLSLDKVIGHIHAGEIPRKARRLREMVEREDAASDAEAGTRPGWADFPRRGSFADAVAWIGLKMARALAHAHAHGFYHRDVKPENILLTGLDGPQLLDFNLAHAPDLAGQARAAHRGGTLPYMAPEHLEAFLDPSRWDDVRAAADLFSLGLILRELLTGRPPARPAGHLPLPRAISMMLSHRAMPLVPIRSINPRVPHALEAIVAKCLAESPGDRYPSARDLAVDLANHLAHRPLAVAANPSVVEASLNRVRRHRLSIGVVVAVAVLSAGILLTAKSALNRGVLDLKPTAATLALVAQAEQLELKGDHDLAHQAILNALKRPDAIACLRRMHAEHPGSLAIHMGLAQSYFEGQMPDLAEQSFGEILQTHPDYAPAYTGLANVEGSRKHHLKAIGWLDLALEHPGPMEPSRARAMQLSLLAFRVRELCSEADVAVDAKDFARAGPLFARSLADLARLKPGPDNKVAANTAFTFAFWSGLARMGRGDVARFHEHDAPLAAASYHAAMEHIPEARRLAAGDARKQAVGNLEDTLRKRLREVDPGGKITALDPADPRNLE